MRKGIEIEVSAADRARLEAIVAHRNSPQKHVWRARNILATADGCGTAEVSPGRRVETVRAYPVILQRLIYLTEGLVR